MTTESTAATAATTTDIISDAQTTEEKFLRQIMVRSQMKEFAADPLIMSRATASITGTSMASSTSTDSRASTSSASATTTGG